MTGIGGMCGLSMVKCSCMTETEQLEEQLPIRGHVWIKLKKMTFSRRKKGKEGDKCGSGCSKESSRDREGTLNKV